MARTQTLVQLSDSLVAMLDERAASAGLSRSALIRQAIEEFLHDDHQGSLDRAISEAYARHPAPVPDMGTITRAVASIEAEPW